MNKKGLLHFNWQNWHISKKFRGKTLQPIQEAFIVKITPIPV